MADLTARKIYDHDSLGQLRKQGYSVFCNNYDKSYRVEGVLDIFTSTRRWHDLKTDKRGSYDDLMLFIPEYFDPRAKARRRKNAYEAILRKQNKTDWHSLGMKVFAGVILFMLITMLMSLASGLYSHSRAQEVQEVCDQYDDYRMCPIIQNQ